MIVVRAWDEVDYGGVVGVGDDEGGVGWHERKGCSLARACENL